MTQDERHLDTLSVSPAEAKAAGKGPDVLFVAGQMVAGRYRVLRFIARGGMGEVYEVQDTELGDRVALKTIRPEIAEGAGALGRFRREIHLARRITHPNVCRMFDIGHHTTATETGTTTDVTFLTMELLPGETLSERIKRGGRMTPAQALPIVRQMAAALATAHAAGIVHRDFKGSNVVLVPARASAAGGVAERAVVTDFGLAHATAGGGDSIGASITGTGDIVGTPAYMAPEQVEGKPVGPAADIYALGVVLYEMLTASFPFTGQSALSVAVRRLKEAPMPLRRVVADVDPTWEAVILRCLERDPADRFASAEDVVKALGGEVVARGRRGQRRVVAIGAGALALAIGAGYVLSRVVQPSPTPRPAPAAAAGGAAPVVASPVVMRRSVAVLGFRNLGQPEAAWLSTAIAEMLRTELAAGGAIRTIPGESVARMKIELAVADADSLASDTLRRIRANLGADFVVLGSYLKLGRAGRLRLDLRLQDAASGELVASSSAEGTEEGVFEVVSKAGTALREALGLGHVSEMDASAVRASLPRDPAAARLYAEGLARLRAFDAMEARRLLERAVAAEPAHPLVHSALAMAWSALGYQEKARVEAKKAFDLSKDLPREERLAVQGLHHETHAAWDDAVETYKALLVFYPDRLDYGLLLANAQVGAGKGQDALETVDVLRRLPAPASEDPRVDLAEAAAAKALTDFGRQQQTAARAAKRAGAQGARVLFAQARLAEGTALVNLGKLDEARRACEEAGEVFAAAGDLRNVARAENIVAVAYARAGDLVQAREKFTKSLEAFRAIGDQGGIALQLGNVAGVLAEQGQLAEARRLYQEALGVAREIADRSQVARALNNLGSVLEEMNDLEASRRMFEQALAAFQELGEKRSAALALSNLGEVLHRQKRLAEAQQRYEASLAASREAGAMDDAAVTLTLFAKLLVDRGDLAAAERALTEARGLFRRAEDRAGEAGAVKELSALAERKGDQDAARRLLEEAARLENAATQ